MKGQYFKKSSIKFYRAAQELIDERIDLLREGETPEWTDLRSLFYATRLRFQNNTGLKESDSKAKELYSDWQGYVIKYIEKYCPEFGIPKEHRWRLRERLNIWAKGKAICQTFDRDKFLVELETRKQVVQDCSFVLLCEKETVSRQLIEELRNRGYQFNHVSTGGFSTTDVQEVAINIAEEMGNNPNFYLLTLHDYDLDGVKIYSSLRKRYNGIIDVGINRTFLESMDIDLDLVEESKINKNHQGELEKWMALEDNGYNEKDFKYLQGEQVEKNRWEGKRIEIDSIHSRIGIKPFADFIEKTILEKCTVWDLGRIGVKDFELFEPDDLYEEAAHEWMRPIRGIYIDIRNILAQPKTSIQGIVNKAISIQMEDLDEKFQQILDEHWEHTHSKGYGVGYGELTMMKKLRDLVSEFDNWGAKWTTSDEYVFDLNEVNKQIEYYDGDVREGKANLQIKVDKIQQRINDDKQEDFEDSELGNRLECIDWGKEELDELEAPDEAELIHQIIDALQKRLLELETK